MDAQVKYANVYQGAGDHQWTSAVLFSRDVLDDSASGIKRDAGYRRVGVLRVRVKEGVDGWIEWDGGVCPVDTEAMIMTKLRNGWESHGPAMAGYHRWDHGRTPDSPLRANDIIAYRLAQEPKA